jgi:hypothetical protein
VFFFTLFFNSFALFYAFRQFSSEINFTTFQSLFSTGITGMPTAVITLLLIFSGFTLLSIKPAEKSLSHYEIQQKVEPVLIHLKNIPQGSKSIPGSQGIIKIENRRFSSESQTLDDMATFENVPDGSGYSVIGWYQSGNNAFNKPRELWGIWKNIEISSQNKELTFVRNMPFVVNVNAVYELKNEANPSLQVGDDMVFEITIRNPSLQNYRSNVILMLKNQITGEVTELVKEVLLSGSQRTIHTQIHHKAKVAGEYYYAIGIFVKQRINQWTDCWDWSDAPLFYVTRKHRSVSFAGYLWDVKAGFGNPGPNLWTNDTSKVWIDARGRLNLTLSTGPDGRWYSTEVISRNFFGYGTYTFYIDADPHYFDPHIVAGIFLYRNDQSEIDIEFSRWGDKDNYHVGNYVIQPSDYPGNQFRFPIITTGSFTTHRIEWRPDQILFSSWHGHYDQAPEGRMIAHWQYKGEHIPQEEKIRLFFNIWLFRGISPKYDFTEIFTISHFTYEPLSNAFKH